MQKYSSKYWIDKLKLQSHPEGGYYKETYHAEGIIPQSALIQNYTGSRSYSTGIYFLLSSDTFSAFHKIQSDEMWHFYEGDSLEIYLLEEKNPTKKVLLGRDIDKGEALQFVIPANTWFAAQTQGNYSLLGCTVAPGFDFADFKLAKREDLIKEFPQEKELITLFTRQ